MKFKPAFLLSILASLFLAGCGPKPEPERVRLYAGAGLRDAVEALCSEFSKQTGLTVEADYAGSGVLLSRIQTDAQADLFMPGDVWYVERLNKLSGSVGETVAVARLIPVIMVPKGNPKKIFTVQDLARRDVMAALGSSKATQIGRLCEQILTRARLDWNSVADKEALTVNELAVWVQMGAADAAIVWDSTAANATNSVDIIALQTMPGETSAVVCGLMKASPRKEAAHAFMQFMAGPDGQRIWKEKGFTTGVNQP